MRDLKTISKGDRERFKKYEVILNGNGHYHSSHRKEIKVSPILEQPIEDDKPG